MATSRFGAATAQRILSDAIRACKLKYDGWPCLGAGLELVYKRGRRALHEARDRPSPKAFHEWRKQVKYLRYALETLTPLWPQMIDEIADQAHELSDYLGAEHDLTVLTQTAVANSDTMQNATLSALMALIERYQSELRQKALSLGLRLYEERPKAFAVRFAHYWSEWVHEIRRNRVGPN